MRKREICIILDYPYLIISNCSVISVLVALLKIFHSGYFFVRFTSFGSRASDLMYPVFEDCSSVCSDFLDESIVRAEPSVHQKDLR